MSFWRVAVLIARSCRERIKEAIVQYGVMYKIDDSGGTTSHMTRISEKKKRKWVQGGKGQ